MRVSLVDRYVVGSAGLAGVLLTGVSEHNGVRMLTLGDEVTRECLAIDLVRRLMSEASRFAAVWTLRGNVLPVGGIKEKVLAARRSGVRTLVLPEANRNNLEAIDRALLRDLKIELVQDIRQVFDIVLADVPVRPTTVVDPLPATDPAREPALQT